MRGPVEYVVLGFAGNRFTGRVAPALAELVRTRTVRILDLVFITKDANGDVEVFEFDEADEFRVFAEIDGEVGGIIGPEDVDYVADALGRERAAALLVWEDVWATPLLEALVDAGGAVIEGGRIPQDLIECVPAALTPAG